MKKVLVIAAHPDDEVLGCGGTIASQVLKGDIVKVVIAAEGLTSRQDSRDAEVLKKELNKLHTVAFEANAQLGVTDVQMLAFPDNRMDGLELLDVVKQIEKVVTDFNPNVIYTHFPNDLNVDHRILSEAVLTATRPMPGSSVSEIYFFEVASSTEWNFSGQSARAFVPNVFVDIADTLAKKMAALKIYESEMRPFPHARSLENLENMAKVRGATVGLKSAEAFVLARSIIR